MQVKNGMFAKLTLEAPSLKTQQRNVMEVEAKVLGEIVID